jgi:hypothetical protein
MLFERSAFSPTLAALLQRQEARQAAAQIKCTESEALLEQAELDSAYLYLQQERLLEDITDYKEDRSPCPTPLESP